jgi:RNA polymerase sigma-54 factor
VKRAQEIHDLIRTLDPKPGLQFGFERNPIIWPDVTILKDQGGYNVIVNDLDFSYLRINHTYANLFRQASITEDARKYLEDKFESAMGLIRGIEQRRLNIYKVVKCIVDIQNEFFDKGIEGLKPLTMSQVAEMVSIHESTVSRVVCSKHVQTPRGLFALKYFFNSGLSSSENDKVCSKSIKYLIQEIISNEDVTNPLSDQEIMDILNNKGIQISRRTVNKYRQSMGIPANNLRKRY